MARGSPRRCSERYNLRLSGRMRAGTVSCSDMADLFISYPRVDREFVRRVLEVLSREHFDVWVDLEDIPPTAKWIDEILSGIESANAFVFVLSPESVASEICALELERA